MVTSPELHLFHALFHPTDGYATVDRRERRTLGSDSVGDTSEKELLRVSHRKHPGGLPREQPDSAEPDEGSGTRMEWCPLAGPRE